MIRAEAVKKAKTIAKRIKDLVYVLQDNNYGWQGYFTLTQNQFDNHPDVTVDESMIILGFDQYGRAC